MRIDLIAQGTVDVEGLVETVDVERITGWRILAALAAFVASIIIGRILMKAIRRAIERIEGVEPYAAKLVGRLVFYLTLTIGLAWSLSIIGIDLVPLLTSLGLLLVVLAFALRGIIENFAAGLTLQTRGPFVPGDQIESNDQTGTVVEINARAVVMDTPDGERVHIPSLSVLTEPIINLTYLGQRRTTLDVGLAYDTDLATARRLIVETTAAIDGILAEPAPEALVHEFGDNTINVAVRFWHDPAIHNGWVVRDAVAVELKSALDAAGMEIAFPQRVLWWGEGNGAAGDLSG